MWNILVSEATAFSPQAKQVLLQVGNVRWEDFSREELAQQVSDTDVLWVRLRSRIDEFVLDNAPRLKVIASPTTGLTHIDLAAAERRKIRILSLQGERQFLRSVRGTAEHTIGLMLSLLRHIPQALEHVRGGGWNRDLFRGTELFGRTVGVIGYGRLGRIVAKYLNAFGSEVLVADPGISSSELKPPARLLSLRDVLANSEILTVHVALNPTTRPLLGREEFKIMKPGALLVNTSRGEVLDEPALIEALESGRLAGAALDVVSAEDRYSESLLIEQARHRDNLIISPHIGGCTEESMTRTEIFLAERLRDVISQMEIH